MKKHRGEYRPSKFEVAMEKGDYKPIEPISDPVEDVLESFITVDEWLDYPDNKTINRLGKWKDHHRNRQETADALGMTRDGFDKWLARLKETYQRHKNRFIRR